MKVGYFADGPWAHKAIELLVAEKSVELAFIVPRYDTQDPVLKRWAERLNIPFILSENVNSDEFIAKVRDFNCDLLISMSFNQIIKKNLIELTPRGFINCHAGALPFYRGRNPLNWVLINGENKFGITVHYIDEGIDTGDIIEQELYPIKPTDTYGNLLELAIPKCGDLLMKAVNAIRMDEATRTPQKLIHPEGTYFCQRKCGDEYINFNWSAKQIYDFVRALAEPGPLARFKFNGYEYHVERAYLIDNAPSYISKNGEVLFVDKRIITVKAADTAMRLQLKSNPSGNFKTGDKLKVGSRIASLA